MQEKYSHQYARFHETRKCSEFLYRMLHKWDTNCGKRGNKFIHTPKWTTADFYRIDFHKTHSYLINFHEHLNLILTISDKIISESTLKNFAVTFPSTAPFLTQLTTS